MSSDPPMSAPAPAPAPGGARGGVDLNLSGAASETLAENLNASEAEKIAGEDASAENQGSGDEKMAGEGGAVGGKEIGNEGSVVPEQSVRRGRGRPRKFAPKAETTPLPTPSFPFQDERKDVFAVNDLVWGKVKSHPWWPGQIFDHSSASEMALKRQKREGFLVAYFGDKTFAWNDESLLRPYQAHFSQMERQSPSEAFVAAVNDSLAEVSRRVELALTCPCFAVEALKGKKVENAGIQEGTLAPDSDSSFIADSFQPERFLEYVQDLAQSPAVVADRLELAVIKAQLKAFNRSKGYPDLPEFVSGSEFGGDAEGPSTKKDSPGKDAASDSASGKGRKRGRESSSSKRKQISEDGRKKKRLSDLMEENDTPPRSSSRRRRLRKREAEDFDWTPSGEIKEKRLDSLGDLDYESLSSDRERKSKVGAIKSPLVSSVNGETSQKRPRGRPRKNAIVGDPRMNIETEKVKQGAVWELSSSGEMLSQLCLAAAGPMREYNSLSMIVRFFTDYRDFLASGFSDDDELLGMTGIKKDRRKLADSKSASLDVFERGHIQDFKSSSLDVSAPGHIQDSYWSDLVITDSADDQTASSGQRKKGGSKMKTGEKKTEDEQPLIEPSSIFSVPMLDPTLHFGPEIPNIGQEVAAKNSININEDKVEECMPTALILHFSGSHALPSESDLIKIFSQYGPLREAEAEILKKSSCAKVVFKRRTDAELAFSSAGKFSIFGPSLSSFKLSYLPSTPKPSHEVPVLHENAEAVSDAMHVEAMVNVSPA
ncbi:uncharacterized protein LOC109724065 [Ananas comosus]|uniref:Serine/threonine-protein kinase ATM n=1 Tax=Ananas comosus TaxID=4615 RepID=A0A199VBE9_ANACO|nr:uncharacterized protein LOC109724065 [Ananas comosus]XP_020108302.1 uncharacterized protein LOC109724065 [Ananas comosus]OAY74338.1 Serine/threonine-protein kinase ATM [Ananas comosus]